MNPVRLALSLILCLSLAAAQEVAESEAAVADTMESEPVASSGAAEETAQPAEAEEGEEIPSAGEDDLQSTTLPVQSGPFIDLFGPTLLSLEMTGPTTAQLHELPTNEALKGKKVIGLYYSAVRCLVCLFVNLYRLLTVT